MEDDVRGSLNQGTAKDLVENDSNVVNSEIPEGGFIQIEGDDLSFLLDLIEEEGELLDNEVFLNQENDDLMELPEEKAIGQDEDNTVIGEQKEASEDQSLVGHVKRKPVRSGAMLPGASSKKRLAQSLVSPRRKATPKNSVRIGEGLYSKNEPGKKI